MRFSGFLILILSACACVAPKQDPAPQASVSGDPTLYVSAESETLPGRGADILRVQAGSPVQQSALVVLPDHSQISSGTVDVEVAGVHKGYTWSGTTLTFAWSDFFGPTWVQGSSTVAKITGSIEYTKPVGTGFFDIEGFVFIVVYDTGYTPLPVDSGYEAWTSSCQVQMTTSGRTALKCIP